MVTKTNKQLVVGAGVGTLGAAILWAYTNLGIMFFALLALVTVNVVVALLEKDMLQAVHRWIKITSSVVIPAIVPLLAHNISVTWTTNETHVLIAVVFAALLSGTSPDIVDFISNIGKKLHLPQAEQKILRAEVDRLNKALAAKAETIISTPTPPTDSQNQNQVHGL